MNKRSILQNILPPTFKMSLEEFKKIEKEHYIKKHSVVFNESCKNSTCYICLSSFEENQIVYKCSHCSTCLCVNNNECQGIEKLIETNTNICPICRKKIF